MRPLFMAAQPRTEARFLSLCFYGHSLPYLAGNQSPKENEQSVPPVDNQHPLFPLQSSYNLPGNFPGFHQHGIMLAVVQQVCPHKAGTYVGEADIRPLQVSELLQRIQISVLKSFGGRVGGSYAQTFCPRNGADSCQMSFPLFFKIRKSREIGRASCRERV